jgi:integrase
VARWIDPKVEAGQWGPTTVYNARKAAFRVFSWASGQGLIPDNPLKGMPRPKPRPRQRAITESEFQKLYEYSGGPLRDLLLALYLTGARPKEVRGLKWSQVREDHWILHEHKTANKTGRERRIFLTQEMKDVMTRLRACAPGEYVFLNTQGRPWTMNALRLQVWRLKKKLGMSEDLCAYLCRHGFGTRAVLRGVDGPTLMELMGHTSQEMISKVYVHLADQHQHLKDAVEKVSGVPATPSPADGNPVRKRALPVNPKKPGRKPAGPKPDQPSSTR